MASAPLRALRQPAAVPLGVAALAATHLVLGAWIGVWPRSFFDDGLGGFGPYNGHYLGDAAAFHAGIGVALLAALRWPALRAGTLAAAAGTLGLHAVNHWLDVGEAHRDAVGILDGVSLSVLAALALALTATAVGERA
jgi:predicted anti-sigma-YlaC factor YlaD